MKKCNKEAKINEPFYSIQQATDYTNLFTKSISRTQKVDVEFAKEKQLASPAK